MDWIFIECVPEGFGCENRETELVCKEFMMTIKNELRHGWEDSYLYESKKLTVCFETHILKDRRRPSNDLDNIAKLVIEALNYGRFFSDQRQVFEINMRMVEVSSGGKEGLRIQTKSFEDQRYEF